MARRMTRMSEFIKTVEDLRSALEKGSTFTKTRVGSNSGYDDNAWIKDDNTVMNDITQKELRDTIASVEERMDKRIDRMERDTDRRSTQFRDELSLRDDQLRRELDLRQESFRAEQFARDAALAEKFAGFLSSQAERDRASEKISESRFERIEKDVTSIKTDSKKVSEDVNGIKVTMAKYLGAAIVIGAIASALLGAGLKHLLP